MSANLMSGNLVESLISTVEKVTPTCQRCAEMTAVLIEIASDDSIHCELPAAIVFEIRRILREAGVNL